MRTHITKIAQCLDETPEATAQHQWAGQPRTTPDGMCADRAYHATDGAGIVFSYSVMAYRHTTDISVMVKRHGVEVRIMVPGDLPAPVVARAAMVALRTTIDTITTTQEMAA